MPDQVRHDGNRLVTPVALVPRLDRGIEPESIGNGCRIKSGMTQTRASVTPALEPESIGNGCRIKSGMTAALRHDSVAPALEPESSGNGCRIRSGMTATFRHDDSGPA
jgi:hypothetical protein